MKDTNFEKTIQTKSVSGRLNLKFPKKVGEGGRR